MTQKPTDSDLEGMDIFDKPPTVKKEDIGLDVEEEDEDLVDESFDDWPYDRELNFDEDPPLPDEIYEEDLRD